MNMFRISGIVLLLLLACRSTLAAFTNFEDLQDGLILNTGGFINSNGLNFHVASGPVRVKDQSPFNGDAGGSGLELRIGATSTELSFVLPPGTRNISLFFGAYDPTSGFVLNGVSSPLAGDFATLNGSTIGGVLVHVTPSTMPPHGIPNRQGQLYLDGPINSLALRGPELSIDNIRIAVPEPTAVGILAFMRGVYGRRRRMRIANV
jgi:hypothetical protein